MRLATKYPHTTRKHSAKGMCASCYTRAWMRANPERDSGNVWLRNHPEAAKFHARKNHLWRKYRIRYKTWETMFAAQAGKCANKQCSRRCEHLDHDHTTKKVRGILCKQCNMALGHVADDIKRLEGLIEYLRETA